MIGDETEGKRADIPSSIAARPQVLVQRIGSRIKEERQKQS
jgi:hypothetical protein